MDGEFVDDDSEIVWATCSLTPTDNMFLTAIVDAQGLSRELSAQCRLQMEETQVRSPGSALLSLSGDKIPSQGTSVAHNPSQAAG